MRKVFWAGTVCAVLVGIGAVVAANHAARYPHSLIGRVLHGASHVAARLSPAVGFSRVLARTQCTSPDVIARVEGIPDEPQAAPEQTPLPAPNPDDFRGGDLPPLESKREEVSSAPIVISEDEPCQPLRVELPRMLPAVEVGLMPFAKPATECPPPPVCQSAPATMPYCPTEEQCEPMPMPAQTNMDSELLAMPRTEEELPAGSGGTEGCEHSEIQRLLQDVNAYKMLDPEPTGSPKADECREDPNHHNHYSGCPFTGQPYPSCPKVKPELHKPNAVPPGGEEPSEPSASNSALRKIRRFKTRQALDEPCPLHPDVDTMEYRASDGQLYDYGPGVL